MQQFKRAQVVILSTDRSIIHLNIKDNLLYKISESREKFPHTISKNLYIISDDEIKGSDWYLYKNKIYKCTGDWAGDKQYQINAIKYDFHKGKQCKKIIATTDTNLNLDIFDKKTCKGDKDCRKHCDCLTLKYKGLPQPSQQFITKYIEEYNKGNIITDVLVEYTCNTCDLIKSVHNGMFEVDCDKCNYKNGNEYPDLKINPKDNTITIKKLKDSWSREEIIYLMKNSFQKGIESQYNNWDENDFNLDNWIKDNL